MADVSRVCLCAVVASAPQMAACLRLVLLLALPWAGAQVDGECVITNDVGDCQEQVMVGEEEEVEETFVLIKPDAVERGLVGEVVGRLERKGLAVVAMKVVEPSRAAVEEHYREHRAKPFFPALVAYMASGRVVAMVWRGRRAVAVVRALLGATDPALAAPGTIRGDLALDKVATININTPPNTTWPPLIFLLRRGTLCTRVTARRRRPGRRSSGSRADTRYGGSRIVILWSPDRILGLCDTLGLTWTGDTLGDTNAMILAEGDAGPPPHGLAATRARQAVLLQGAGRGPLPARLAQSHTTPESCT